MARLLLGSVLIMTFPEVELPARPQKRRRSASYLFTVKRTVLRASESGSQITARQQLLTMPSSQRHGDVR